MTALHGGDAVAFETLLQMLMATDNEQRSQGEKAFQELQNRPDVCANHLIRGLRSADRAELRSLSAVLLRRVCCEYCLVVLFIRICPDGSFITLVAVGDNAR